MMRTQLKQVRQVVTTGSNQSEMLRAQLAVERQQHIEARRILVHSTRTVDELQKRHTVMEIENERLRQELAATHSRLAMLELQQLPLSS